MDLKKLGANLDKIFASKDITDVDKTLESRTYYDNETKLDYGYNDMWDALDVARKNSNIRNHIKSAFWYNIIKGEKDDLLELF